MRHSKATTLFFSLLTLALTTSCHQKPKPRQKLPLVQTVYPIQKTVPVYIDVPGHVEPIHSVDIQAQVNGEVTAIHYKEGSYVEAGAPLISIDNRPYVADKNKAEGDLVQNKARLRFAKDTTLRNEPLVVEDFISQNNFDKLVSNVESLEGTILANLAEIESAQINIGFCDIRAPISGVLGNRRVDMGNIVTAYSDQTLVTIKQIAPIWTSFGIDEGYISTIQQEWKKHPIEVVVYQDSPLKPQSIGHLVFINNSVNEKTGQILMKGHFENHDKKLWPGRYVKIRLITHQEEAIVVPSQAIQNGQKGSFVFVVGQGNSVKICPVELGQRQDDGNTIVVKKGLTTHDQVVINGQINIANKTIVEIDNQQLDQKYNTTKKEIQ